MAKQSAKSDRQAVIEQMRKKQRGSERRRGFAIVGVCALIALLIVGAAAFQPIKDWWDQRQYSDVALADIGAPASACQKITTKKANGTQDHVEPGTPIAYSDAPPAFGQHYNVPDPMARKMYTSGDRPELGTLVHNLEHGYTMLWYDETAAKDSGTMDQVRAIAAKFAGTIEPAGQVQGRAVDVLGRERQGLPEGPAHRRHALVGRRRRLRCRRQAAGRLAVLLQPSGAALESFMTKYPYLDSPEPNGA